MIVLGRYAMIEGVSLIFGPGNKAIPFMTIDPLAEITIAKLEANDIIIVRGEVDPESNILIITEIQQ